jgi:predicted small secreted protein
MRNLLKHVIAVALFCSAGLSVSACNTVHGAGRDVERGGEKIQDAADASR